ncbi:MAG: ABC transporter substrate-binding protein [Aliarcobacter sp.]
MKKLILILLLISLPFSLYATDSLEKINLQLQWKHQFEFAGFYMAKEKGYYKEVGLDVNFIEFDNNTNIVQNILDNENTYGITYSNLISEFFNGKPLVFVANFFKQSPLALVTQKEISSISDLKNKKVMGVSDQIHSSMFLLVFKRFDIKTDDFLSIPPTFNIEDFITKKVDAMTVFTTNETYFLDKLNYKYNLINPTIFGAEFYDLNLFTSQAELKKHPFRVEKFKQATIKGWEYALKNKDETIDIILKNYNTQNKTKEALLYEANKIEKLMMPSIYPIGSIDKNRVQLIIDDLINLNLISKKGNNNLDDLIYEKTKLPLTDEEINYLEK